MSVKFAAGDIVEHIRKGNRYRIIFDAKRGSEKVNGVWVPAYTYRGECDHAGPIFTQNQADFEEKFRRVE